MRQIRYTLAALWCFFAITSFSQKPPFVLLKNVNLIDGTGSAVQKGVDVLIEGKRFVKVQKGISQPDATQIDGTGKTVIPGLISAHTHVGTLKGTSAGEENYTRENILRQLKRYEDYGIGSVLVMGTDRPMLFETGLRDSTIAGLLPGARFFSAGYGFNTPANNPASWMNLLLRPEKVEDVPMMMNKVAAVKPTVIKMWVDDHGGNQKMKPEIYKAIIDEAHNRKIRVAAHLFYMEDAKTLVKAGLDIIAHSIRDKEVDAELLKMMKDRNVIYIPTLTLDKYNFAYGENPDWINDEFFKSSLEPGVYEMLTENGYHDKVRNSPDYEKNKSASQIARTNLKRIHDAGIVIALGTDSGAFPIRAQGFSEHLEMEMMTQAGLTADQVISISTQNAAKAIGVEQTSGTVQAGKIADFVILDKNPEDDIKNTRSIVSVWKDGKKVSDGPLKK